MFHKSFKINAPEESDDDDEEESDDEQPEDDECPKTAKLIDKITKIMSNDLILPTFFTD